MKKAFWLFGMALPLLFVSAFAIIPLFQLLYLNRSAITILLPFSTGPSGIVLRRAIFNSLEQAALGTVFSLMFGLPLGLFLGLHEFRGKRLVRSIVILPFFLPSIVVVLAFIDAFGGSSPLDSGLTGITAVNTFFNAPLIALLSSAALESRDPSLDEAAMTLGAGRWARFAHIWGREPLWAAGGGAVLTFLYSFSGFTAPLIIGGPQYFTLEAWIYYLVRTVGDIPLAASLGAFEALALLIPVLAYTLLLQRHRVPAGAGNVHGEFSGPFAIAGLLFAVLWIVFDIYVLSSVVTGALLMHHGIYFLKLFSGTVFRAIGISTVGAVLNSLFYGFMSTIIVCTIGLAWITGRRRLGLAARSLDFIQYVPLVISAVILAFSLSIAYSFAYSSNLVWMLIILSQSVIAIPVIFRVLEAGFMPVPSSLAEAATMLGGNALFEVELPLIAGAFATAVVFGFAMSVGEFTSTNFLATPAFIPLSVEIYDLRDARLFGISNAAASLLLIISVVSFYLIQRIGEKFVAVR